MMTNNDHCTSSFLCLKRMRWNERVYMQKRERENVQLSHTYKRPSSVCLSRRVDYNSSKEEKRKREEFFSLWFSHSLWMFLFSSHTFIQSSVMPSFYGYSLGFQSLFIIFMIYFHKTLSINDNQHQILKADVGQDVTMSCLFDQDHIEQVWIPFLSFNIIK